MTTVTSTIHIVLAREAPIAPSSQKVMPRTDSASPRATRMRLVMAEKNWPTSTPVSTTRVETKPVPRSRSISRPKLSRAPMAAPPVSPSAKLTGMSSRATTAPVEAP